MNVLIEYVHKEDKTVQEQVVHLEDIVSRNGKFFWGEHRVHKVADFTTGEMQQVTWRELLDQVIPVKTRKI